MQYNTHSGPKISHILFTFIILKYTTRKADIVTYSCNQLFVLLQYSTASAKADEEPA